MSAHPAGPPSQYAAPADVTAVAAVLSKPLTDHRRAVQEFAAAAERVTADHWLLPRSEGKWSPGEVTLHVALAYEVFTRELREGVRIARRLPWWKQLGVRAWYLGKILRTGIIPPGRAPREARPLEAPGDQRATIERLRSSAAGFERAVLEAHQHGPRRHVTHPYFGQLNLPTALRFAAVHARHHCRQLGAGK